MKYAFRIKELRQENGMTQAEVADKLGYSPSAITMWETGARNPPSSILPSIAKVFDCSIDDLYIGSDYESDAPAAKDSA